MVHDQTSEDLRRCERVRTCCRVTLVDRYGAAMAVTEDVSARGCRVVASRPLRRGTRLRVTISSDALLQDLEVEAEAVWSSSNRLGLRFLAAAAGRNRLTPEQWVRLLVEHGSSPGSSTLALPLVSQIARRPAAVASDRAGDGENLVRLPLATRH